MNSMTREALSVLLLGLVAGCEKDAIRAEKPGDAAKVEDAAKAAAQPSAANSVGASEVTPAASGKAAEKTCAPGGCAPGKCGKE